MGLPRRAAVTPEGVSRGSMGPFETQAADACEHRHVMSIGSSISLEV